MKLILLQCLLFINTTLALDLNQQEIEQINRGEMVVKKEVISGKTWPKITIYVTVDSKPAEAMAIFAAFDHQKNYVPNILVSEVVAQPKSTTVHTKYEMYMPWPLSNSKYVHGTNLSRNDDSYRINWFLVESNVADDIEGLADFSPYGENKSLLTYESHITPKSFLAGLFEGAMVDDVQKTVGSIKKTIEKESAESTDVLKKYLNILNLSIEGKKIYIVD